MFHVGIDVARRNINIIECYAVIVCVYWWWKFFRFFLVVVVVVTNFVHFFKLIFPWKCQVVKINKSMLYIFHNFLIQYFICLFAEEPTESQTTNKSLNDTSNKSSATTNGRTSPSSLNANYSQILSDNNKSNDSYHHYNSNNNNSNNYNNTNPGASSLNNRNNNNNSNIHYNNGYKKHYTNNKENSNFVTTGNSYYNRERSQRSYYKKSSYKDYRSGSGIVSNVKDKKLETKSNGEEPVEGEEKNETVVTPPILFNEGKLAIEMSIFNFN